MKTNAKNGIFFIIFTLLTILTIFVLVLIKDEFAKPKHQNTNTNEPITIVLDAGHGGEDGGAVGKGNTCEKALNLSIALKIGEMLSDSGIDVVYTRTEDVLLYDKNSDYKNKKKALDLAARVKKAQETPNCVFVSIHMNSFSQSQYSGLQVYFSKNNPQSATLANSIQGAVKAQLQPQNKRKAMEATSSIYVLDRLECPAILIECGFVSNAEECRLLSTEVYQKQLSEIISQEIEKYVEKIQKPY